MFGKSYFPDAYFAGAYFPPLAAVLQTLQRIRTATLRVLMARVQVLDVALFRSLTLKILAFRAHVAPVAVVSRARTLEMLDERQKGIGI